MVENQTLFGQTTIYSRTCIKRSPSNLRDYNSLRCYERQYSQLKLALLLILRCSFQGSVNGFSLTGLHVYIEISNTEIKVYTSKCFSMVIVRLCEGRRVLNEIP